MKKFIDNGANNIFANFVFLLFQKIIKYFAQTSLATIVVFCLVSFLFFYTSILQNHFSLFSFLGNSREITLDFRGLAKIISVLGLFFLLVGELLKIILKRFMRKEVKVPIKNKIIISLFLIILIHFLAIFSVFFNDNVTKSNKNFFIFFFIFAISASISSLFSFFFFSWVEVRINEWRIKKFVNLNL